MSGSIAKERVKGEIGTLQVSAEGFSEGEKIPDKHSAYYEDVSPAIRWTGEPEGTRSIAMILEDPDAPRPEPFVHWLIANIPGELDGLPESLPPTDKLDIIGGAMQGANHRSKTGYFGPRPPAGHGIHRYHFQVFALDTMLDLPLAYDLEELMRAMESHVLAKGEIIGTYEAPSG